MKAYGIWNTKAQAWATDSEGLVRVWYTAGAAAAQINQIATDLNTIPGALFAEVAEIGEDGLPVEVEHD